VIQLVGVVTALVAGSIQLRAGDTAAG
jgi:hypothetical protein